MHSDFDPHVIDNPPMPWQEYERKAWQNFGRYFAAYTLSALGFAGIVYPWSHALACSPFWLMLFAGLWLLLGRRAQ